MYKAMEDMKGARAKNNTLAKGQERHNFNLSSFKIVRMLPIIGRIMLARRMHMIWPQKVLQEEVDKGTNLNS
jgi:hypothetical protein